MVILERMRVFYTDPLDPPYILYVEFAFLFTLLPVVSLDVALKNPSFIPLTLLFLLSLPPHLKRYLPLISKVLGIRIGGAKVTRHI